MNKLLVLLLVAFATFTASAGQTRGYIKRNGTYVAPHQRTSPNGTSRDNYGSAGNYNPNKGKVTK